MPIFEHETNYVYVQLFIQPFSAKRNVTSDLALSTLRRIKIHSIEEQNSEGTRYKYRGVEAKTTDFPILNSEDTPPAKQDLDYSTENIDDLPTGGM